MGSNLVASSEILVAMATKMVLTWRVVCNSFVSFFFFSSVQQLKKQAWKKFGEEHPVCQNSLLVLCSNVDYLLLYNFLACHVLFSLLNVMVKKM